MSSNAVISEDELVSLFSKAGFEDKKAKEIVKNKKVALSLYNILDKNTEGNDDKKLALLHQLAIHESKNGVVPNHDIIIDSIRKGDLKTTLQVTEGIKYLQNNEAPIDKEKFNEATGVGIEITTEEAKAEIAKYLDSIKSDLETKRYSILAKVLVELKNQPTLKWAPPQIFKPILDEEFLARLGPKDERDNMKKKEKKPKTAAKATSNAAAKKNIFDEPEKSMFAEGFLGALHKPGEEPQKYPELLEEHRKFINGKVLTRFPPEPNGFLHIGHSKAIMVNFGYAQYNGGKCYLRFDDTNPEAEEEVYFNSIKEMVSWLGYKPWKITYSSDYFDQLYELAIQLIKADRAYICHCTPEEVKVSRGLKEDGTLGGDRVACKHRSQSIEHNLREFEAMKDGKYAVGEATLRMKQDLESPSPQMWDLIAYRVLNAPHPRTGTKWKIYPTYDFTHCLVDSFENITHSLCTTEFYLSRESYEWLCDQVHVFRPAQREYGRLNITGTVLSKRKIAKLVDEHFVRGWDDPRLFTLEAIRRRGVPPGAILSFINTLGVTTSTTNIQVVRFESAIRKYLEDSTPRLMMILDPIEVVVENLPEDYEELVTIPYRAGTKEFGDRNVPFTNKFYIERADFSENTDDKEFFRLTPNQPVGLIKVPYTVSFKSVEKDADGKITRIHVKYDNEDKPVKPRTYIQWVPISKKYNSPVRVSETRVYNQLFKSENPSAHPDGYLKDINPESEVIYDKSVIEHNFDHVIKNSPWVVDSVKNSEFYVEEDKSGKEICRFQAMRVGYFTLDKESTDDKIILNRIVSLKDNTK